jgi:hypothetical protein
MRAPGTRALRRGVAPPATASRGQTSASESSVVRSRSRGSGLAGAMVGWVIEALFEIEWWTLKLGRHYAVDRQA